ncbi:DUF29 domain-containing protein [Trinickia fusca]|uniref:DUF29 domain-containing protein n=1 Tax=Trinickia fusca TaxID=2419777 RepID=A0A494XWW9_9BURK|nr:DUF29 domain-containing protein [Trinickia fusca]RKP52599.1 DUF29 domain-containing protein [Trinickia fusca]
MGTEYEHDVVAWAHEQAALLRAGKFSALDIEHIAEEIEDVGKSEQRELANRMAVLLSHLLKWQFQPERQGASWEATIHTQRNSIERRIRKTPSLKASLSDADWWADAWDDAVEAASKETGSSYVQFPETCPWPPEQVLDQGFFPTAR